MTYTRKHAMWTGAEIVRLRRFWPVMSKQGLEREFAPRSWYSIKEMAYRSGMKRPRHLGGKSDWKAIAKAHQPIFNLPTDVPVQQKRPWS